MVRNASRNTVINPLSGRVIQIGGNTYNRLIIEAYDHINGELVRRESASPLPRRQYYLNIDTGHSILVGSRRYYELINAGWEILENYYLIPPDYGTGSQHEITQRTYIELLAIERDRGALADRESSQNPTTYESLMAVHGEGLTNLNISLCRECFYPLKAEGGEYCDSCKP